MALPTLYFPPVPNDGDTYTASNGVTYSWSNLKKSWIPIKGVSDGDTDLDTELSKKVSRSGDNLFGSLYWRPADVQGGDTSLITASIDPQGIISSRRFVFKDPGSVARINIRVTEDDGSAVEENLVSFDVNTHQARFYNGIKINTDRSFPAITLPDNTGSITLVDCSTKSTGSETFYSIKLGSSSSFQVRNQLRNENSPSVRFSVSDQGDCIIRSTSYNSLVVSKIIPNQGDTEATQAMRVDAQSGMIYGSENLNDGLLTGKQNITNSEGQNLEYTYDDDRLLITKGYMDEHAFFPGDRVCATKEADTKVGGFWLSGGTLYVRTN